MKNLIYIAWLKLSKTVEEIAVANKAVAQYRQRHLISKIYELIDKHLLEEAEEELSKLINILGEYDSEVMRIKSYLDLERD